jgi:hypothetical protein
MDQESLHFFMMCGVQYLCISPLGAQLTKMLLSWPPRSPDATPCDFFLWGYVNDQIYVPPPPATITALRVRIRTAIETITADMLQTVWNEVDYRVDVCRITKGANIEHL